MKIISWNVNGIRAVERKELLRPFVEKYQPDVFLIQEIKAKPEQLTALGPAYPHYQQFYHSAAKPGYAGTAIWVRQGLEAKFSTGMPGREDTEGRIARVDIGDQTILGIYFPNGGKSPEAWDDKLVFYDQFLAYINQLRSDGRQVIWAGDVNCAHNEIDLARPKDNDGEIGFHPSERAWLDRVVADNWVDVYRDQNPDGVVYSWWHLITRSRARNVGWRIDYAFVDQSLMPQVSGVEYLTDIQGSDHCPVQLITQ